MSPEENPNRFGKAVDLERLRGTSTRPSLVRRAIMRLPRPKLGSIAITIILAVAIVVALAIGFWSIG